MPAAAHLDELVGAWHTAFRAAERGLLAARLDHDLGPSEAGSRARRLAAERAETAGLLGSLAQSRDQRPLIVRLISSPREAKRLLGLPSDTAACVFNVDGVLVASAAVHADAWKATFDGFLSRRTDRTGGTFLPFSRRVDYPALVHGRSREDAVREFLASRGVSLPEGRPDDEPDAETVRGLANRKSRALLERLERADVDPYAGASLYLQLARDAGVRCAVVSGSTHTAELLASVRLDGLVDALVDGRVAVAEGLARKPAPDMLLAASARLGVEPVRTAVFETNQDGVAAARAGGFELVVVVEHERPSRATGADVVVSNLGEIVERELAA